MFQQYRISKVHVHWYNLVPVAYQQGALNVELPIVYQVPMINGATPLPAQTAYIAYKNVKIHSYRRDFRSSFVPYVNTGTANSPFIRAPRLSTTVVDEVHYGQSFLFTKLSPTATTYNLRGILEC